MSDVKKKCYQIRSTKSMLLFFKVFLFASQKSTWIEKKCRYLRDELRVKKRTPSFVREKGELNIFFKSLSIFARRIKNIVDNTHCRTRLNQ